MAACLHEQKAFWIIDWDEMRAQLLLLLLGLIVVWVLGCWHMFFLLPCSHKPLPLYTFIHANYFICTGLMASQKPLSLFQLLFVASMHRWVVHNKHMTLLHPLGLYELQLGGYRFVRMSSHFSACYLTKLSVIVRWLLLPNSKVRARHSCWSWAHTPSCIGLHTLSCIWLV